VEVDRVASWHAQQRIAQDLLIVRDDEEVRLQLAQLLNNGGVVTCAGRSTRIPWLSACMARST